MRRRVRMVDLAREVCGGSIVGRRIAVLGAAFKPHSDDIRDSPALSVAAQMQLQGAQVTVTDPQAIDNARKKWPELSYADTVEDAVRDAEVVLLLTEWPEYVALDPVALKEQVVACRGSSTAATASTRSPGGPPAGPTARWAGRDLHQAIPLEVCEQGPASPAAPASWVRTCASGCWPRATTCSASTTTSPAASATWRT